MRSEKTGSFVGDVAKLSFGTVIGIASTILVSPVLTRLFPPEAFGVASVFLALMMVLAVLACLRYEHAIMMPEDDRSAAALLVASLLLALCFSALLGLLVIFFGRSIASLLKTEALNSLLWLLPFSVLCQGVYEPMRFWNTRKRRYGILSRARASVSVVQNVSKLAAGFSGFVSAIAITISNVVGYFFAAVCLAYTTVCSDWHLVKCVDGKDIARVTRRYVKFPAVSAWGDLLYTLSLYLPFIFLARYYDQKVVGYYSLGFQLVNIPVMVIGVAIAQVYYQRAAEAIAGGKLAELTDNMCKRLVSLSFFPFLVLIVIGPELFALVFGAEWAEAGVYVQILSMMYVFVFIAFPLRMLCNVNERQEAVLFFNSLLLAVQVLTLCRGGSVLSARMTLIYVSMASAVLYLAFIMWLIGQAGLSCFRVLAYIAWAALYAAPCLILIAATKYYFECNSWLIMLSALMCLALYYGFIIYNDAVLSGRIRRLLGCSPKESE